MSHNFYAAVEGGATKGAQSNWQVTLTFNHTRLKDLSRVGGSVCNSDEVQWRDPHLPDDAMRIVDSV